MIISSRRFGRIEAPLENIITMQRPILGFEAMSRFILLDREEFRPVLWLQSVEDESLAFPVVTPKLFFPDYRIDVHAKEVAELFIDDPRQVETFVIITIPDNPHDMTVNLQGPIILNTVNNLAKQLVLVNSPYSVEHRLLDKEYIGQRETQYEVEPAGA